MTKAGSQRYWVITDFSGMTLAGCNRKGNRRIGEVMTILPNGNAVDLSRAISIAFKAKDLKWPDRVLVYLATDSQSSVSELIEFGSCDEAIACRDRLVQEAVAALKLKAREHPRDNSEAGSPLPVDRKPLFMVREEPGGGKWWLSTEQSYPESRLAEDHEITLEAMADMLDQDAESGNLHDFVFCHAALAMLLHRMAGREVATQAMRYLVDLDGLHGIGSTCRRKGTKAVAAMLGVPLDDSGNWRLDP
jgi:hypothetical protein